MAAFFEIDLLEAGDKDSGDAIAVRHQDDYDRTTIYVVDGGYTDDGKQLVSHLRKYYNNPPHLDHVVLTHPDGDHAAGLKTVLESFSIGTLWMNRPWVHVEELKPRFQYDYTTEGLIRRLKSNFPNVADLEKIAMDRQVTIRPVFQGDSIGAFVVLAPSRSRYLDCVVDSDKTPEPKREAQILDKVYERAVAFVRKIAALWGQENLKGDSDGTSPENEMSVVQFANICQQKILLTGDAGVEALSEAYEFAKVLHVALPGIDRFQVPHHGSRRNLSSEVLDKWLGPKLDRASGIAGRSVALISANRNDKDHPRKAVVRALIHRGAKPFQTLGTLCSYYNSPKRDGWSAAERLAYPEDMEEE